MNHGYGARTLLRHIHIMKRLSIGHPNFATSYCFFWLSYTYIYYYILCMSLLRMVLSFDVWSFFHEFSQPCDKKRFLRAKKFWYKIFQDEFSQDGFEYDFDYVIPWDEDENKSSSSVNSSYAMGWRSIEYNLSVFRPWHFFSLWVWAAFFWSYSIPIR